MATQPRKKRNGPLTQKNRALGGLSSYAIELKKELFFVNAEEAGPLIHRRCTFTHRKAVKLTPVGGSIPETTNKLVYREIQSAF